MKKKIATRSRREFLQATTAVALASAARARAGETGFPLSICNETFEGWSFEEACRGAREAGFSGLEIAPFTLSDDPATLPPGRRAELRATLAGEGLALVGLHWLLKTPPGLHVTTPDAALRSRSWDYVRRLVDLCADLGEGGVLVFGSGKGRSPTGGSTRDEALGRFEEGMAGVAPHAEERGCTFALEPLAPRFSDILNTVDEAVAMVRRIGSPAVQTMIDCRQTAALEGSVDAAEVILEHHEHIRHVHINETDGRHPGTGTFPFDRVLAALRKVEYGGWLSLEVFNFEAGGERIARETVQFIRKTERRLPAL
jgi:sugar phosphate isomerase/epimerase